MHPKTGTNLAAYVLLITAGGISFMLPESISVPSLQAAEPASLRLTGVVRDFRHSHPDFQVVPVGGRGHYAGTVKDTLSPAGRPVFSGKGAAGTGDPNLLAHWSFDEGSGSTAGDGAGTNHGTLLGGPQWTAGKVGGALRFDGADDYINVLADPSLRITSNVTISGWFMLDEDFDASSGTSQLIVEKYLDNEHDTTIALVGTDYGRGEPARGALVFKVENGPSGDSYRYKWTNRTSWTAGQWYQFAVVFNAAESATNAIFIDGVDDTSSTDAGSEAVIDWDYDVDFRIGGKDADSAQLSGPRYFKGLIDDIMIFDRALTEEDFAGSNIGYKVTSQWTDSAGRPIAPHLFNPTDVPGCVSFSDSAGSLGLDSDGGIDSEASFEQWFADRLGTNLSATHAITLVDDGSGTYEYLDDYFHPIDDRLLGNEGDAHNEYLTYALNTEFTYDECSGQFIEFQGGDGAWLFVDRRLAIDLGGVGAPHEQYLEIDRLGLVDGEDYRLDLFYAQRDSTDAVFRLRTNIELRSTGIIRTVSGSYD